jgi:alkanesulfonate monooxygenase SsuD/methylene tetrahydromethanopterin reductase-like flavin-dependent oxidoreductase (luciferase family)
MRFGYFVSNMRANPGESDAQLLRDSIEQVEAAEAAGFDIIWFPERHFFASATSPHPLISIVDSARRTRKIRLGTSVLIAPYRHPLILAEEIGLVDQLTEGRLEIGFARGATLYEYQRFGLDDREAAGRTQECLDVLLGIWRSEGEFGFQGKYFQFEETYANPRPLQKPYPPMSMAARSPESLRYCIQNGLAIHTTPLRQPKSAAQTTINTIAAVVEEFPDTDWPDVAIETETFISEDPETVMNAMRHLEAIHIRTNNFGKNGRKPVMGYGSLEPLPAGLEITAEQLAERCVVGDPDAVLRQVREYRDMGMTEYIAHMDFGQSQRDILRSIELFGSKVISQDWSMSGSRRPKTFGGGASAEKRQALQARYAERFGAQWQELREADWIKWFEEKSARGEETFEIFDVSVNPGLRAEATGIVPTTGKLCLLRNLSCPKCGRPSIVLSYRARGEAPSALAEAAARSEQWNDWHDRHP